MQLRKLGIIASALFLISCGGDGESIDMPKQIESLTFEQDSYQINSGAMVRMQLRIKLQNGIEEIYNNQLNPHKVEWVSANNDIATVTNAGMVKGVKRGSTTITAQTPYYKTPITTT